MNLKAIVALCLVFIGGLSSQAFAQSNQHPGTATQALLFSVTGVSLHTAPGGKNKLHVETTKPNTSWIEGVKVGDTVLTQYLGTGEVPSGMYRVSGSPANPDIEFGDTPPADAEVEVTWGYDPSSGVPTITEDNPAWT